MDKLREKNSQDELSSTHRIVLLYNTVHTAHYNHQYPSFAIAGVGNILPPLGCLSMLADLTIAISNLGQTYQAVSTL